MLKSTIVSVAWTAFLLGLDPATKVLVTSYNEFFAEKLSSDVRRFMDSKSYRRIFPKTRLVKRASTLLETDQGGGRLATSIGRPTTGFGAEWIIMDDPLNANELHSPTAREAVWRYYSQALFTRTTQRARVKMIVLMQRLHADDFSGRLLELGGWRHLSLPAQAKEDLWVELGKPEPHLFKEGELLCAELLPLHELEDVRAQMGSIPFQAQFLQDPVPDGGNIIDLKSLRYYDQAPPWEDGQITLSVDTALETNTANDFSAISVWLRVGRNHYLLFVWRAQVTYGVLKQKVADLYDFYGARSVLVERKVNGSALIDDLAEADILAEGIAPNLSKQARLENVAPFFEGGFVHLPKEAPWLAAFESELLGFPNTKNDDQVDTVTQYLNWARRHFRQTTFIADFGFDDPISHDAIADAILWMRQNGRLHL
jgi:predicted phage terminase large subunit-like protein